MEINYLILAHKNPKQLKRLIQKLSDVDCFFYIHIDKNIEIEPFLLETSGLKNVRFIIDQKREPGTWADVSIVKATINLLEQIIADKRTGYCVLLSAQDYPIKDKFYIKRFFSDNYGTDFIEAIHLPSDNWSEGGLNRINKYKINLSDKRGDYILSPSIFQKQFYRFSTLKIILKLVIHTKFLSLSQTFKKRNFPNYLEPYGGCNWWAITTETAKKAIDFLKIHPDYLIYHKYTLAADEVFFQSIIMHLHEDKTVKLRKPLTYTNWLKKNVPLPVTFTCEDFIELTNQPADILFARKFDVEMDEDILNKIDEFHNITISNALPVNQGIL